jgi:putative membrane protein
MIRIASLFAIAALLGACSFTGDSMRGAGAGATSPDTQYMRDIAQANLAEIETGKLAVTKAQSADVRRFGQHMIDEHSKMLDEGARLAQQKGMGMPKEPDAKHKAAAKKLEQVSGQGFDRAYMEQMVKDHGETMRLLEQTVSEAKDRDIQAIAQKAIPQVRQHLDMARRLAGDVVGLR